MLTCLHMHTQHTLCFFPSFLVSNPTNMALSIPGARYLDPWSPTCGHSIVCQHKSLSIFTITHISRYFKEGLTMWVTLTFNTASFWCPLLSIHWALFWKSSDYPSAHVCNDIPIFTGWVIPMICSNEMGSEIYYFLKTWMTFFSYSPQQRISSSAVS